MNGDKKPANEFKFQIVHPGERAAGIRSYEETVTVQINYGLAPGTEAEFKEGLVEFLKEWYDGAHVYDYDEYTERCRQEEAHHRKMMERGQED